MRRTWILVASLPAVGLALACSPGADPGGGTSSPSPTAQGQEVTPPRPAADGRPAEIASYELKPGQSLDVVETSYPDGKPLLRREVLRDADGMINHGHFQRWHPNGGLAEDGWYYLGQRHGTYLIVAETGLKQDETNYDRGRRQGPSVSWTEMGQVKESASYVEDEYDGDYELYYFPGGGLREQGAFRLGKRIGTWRFWYADGTLQNEANYADGLLEGPAVEFDEQGRKLAERSYAGGVPDGLQVEYYPQGGVQAEARYVAGRLEGLQRRWYPDGTLQYEGEMRDGKREGRWTYYGSDGTVNEGWSGEYRNDERVSG